jgi:trk system potassium uptake protein TrkA
MTGMTQWWQWQSSSAQDVSNSFAVIGVGRFGSAVCRELLRAGAEVLAIDLNARAIDELLQDETGIEARIVDCTDEDALREAGALDVGTVVVGISEPIEASITATLIVKDAPETRVQQVIARATSDLHEKMLPAWVRSLCAPTSWNGSAWTTPTALRRSRFPNRSSGAPCGISIFARPTE